MNNKLHLLLGQVAQRILPLLVRTALLTALFLPIASPATHVRAATTPVTLTISELDQTGSNFDFTTLGDFYAQVSITSNEPATGFLGNGDQGPDIQGAAFGTDDRSFSLRSERGTGGQNTGRVYTIKYRVTDASGNFTDATATVKVPTSQGNIH